MSDFAADTQQRKENKGTLLLLFCYPKKQKRLQRTIEQYVTKLVLLSREG